MNIVSETNISLNSEETETGNDSISSEEIGGAESSEEDKSSEETAENESSDACRYGDPKCGYHGLGWRGMYLVYCLCVRI